MLVPLPQGGPTVTSAYAVQAEAFTAPKKKVRISLKKKVRRPAARSVCARPRDIKVEGMLSSVVSKRRNEGPTRRQAAPPRSRPLLSLSPHHFCEFYLARSMPARALFFFFPVIFSPLSRQTLSEAPVFLPRSRIFTSLVHVCRCLLMLSLLGAPYWPTPPAPPSLSRRLIRTPAPSRLV